MVTALLSEHSVTSLDVVHHADALAWLRALPDEWADMMLTSPPYDNLRAYKGYSFPFEAIAHEAYRVLKPGGVLVWVTGDSVVDGSRTLTHMRQCLYLTDDAGFYAHDVMVWTKYLPGVFGKRYNPGWELMYIGSKGEPKAWNPIMRRNLHAGTTGGGGSRKGAGWKSSPAVVKEFSPLTNYWHIQGGPTKDGTRHPAMFSEELAERHILTWSNPGDLVVDFFMGSGTVAKVARSLGRHYAGCDISREYVDIARKRLAKAYTLPLFDRVEAA